MRRVVCGAIALICTTVCAQGPPVRPEFEVASVRPAALDHGSDGRLAQITREFMRSELRPGEIPMTGSDRVRLKNWALLDLIAAAYSVRATQVSGPAWLSDQVFDIEAKVPDGTPKVELNSMLQSLLEERFGLKAHRASQTGQGFALVVGKNGPRLKSAEPSPTAPAQALTEEELKTQQAQDEEKVKASMAANRKRMQESRGRGNNPGKFDSQSWSSITMEDFAAQLVRFVEAPVIDETGLTGSYSVKIRTSKDSDVADVTVFDAVEKLGLKLEPRKVTVATVVVDQVFKTSTAN